jgi:2,3-dimethylmalate lyase
MLLKTSSLLPDRMGFRIAVFPFSGLYSATYAMQKIIFNLKDKGLRRVEGHQTNFNEFNELVALQTFLEMDQKCFC